ncbi:MAG TPA: ABC transporter permease, partial [Gemmatimonadales bacterium]|nr:ABC transporter permease [Gemmatimonadales bacterium]
MTDELLTSFLAAAVRVATPLLLAALGETVTERGGVINLGIEGAMLCGALAAALGASAGGPWVGCGAAMLAGVALSSLFALIAVQAGAEQIITGTALTLGSVGLTGAIYRQAYGPGGVGLSLPTLPNVPLPGLSQIPAIGPALFAQSVLTYAAYVAVPLLWWLLFRTAWGLRLRAAGESAENARAAGVRVGRVRATGVVIGGGFAGLAGASLVLAQVGTFAEKMTAGRGFIAIAIVVLG